MTLKISGTFVLPFTLGGPQSEGSSVSSSARSLSLNLKNHYSQTLEQLTSAWPLQTSTLTPIQVGSAESYINLLNLENGSDTAASLSDPQPFIRANSDADQKDRNSAIFDEK